MNAVKSCLTVLAVALVAGACGGDQTAPDAGADLSIRATPSAVWMRNLSTASVLLEAADKLGGSTTGTWKVESQSGAFISAALDTSYQSTSAGPLDLVARFFITATSEGDGTITFSGTGGTFTMPVRVAPDSNTFNVALSTTTPALGATFTATAPTGIRFTAGTAVRFYHGPAAADTSDGLARPSVVSMSADSTVATILPAPGATGNLRFTGVANVSTPGLSTFARSVASVTVPPITTLAATFSNSAPAVNTPITLTMPANFKLRPTSTFTGGAGAMTGVVLSIAPDSNSMSILPTPGNAPLSVGAIKFVPIPSLSFALLTSTNTNVGAPPDPGADDPFDVGGDAALFHFAAPTVVGTATGFYALPSFTGPDQVGDGGIGTSEAYIITFATPGTYQFVYSWDNAADLDLFLVDAGFNSIIGQSFNNAGLDEVISLVVAAGTTQIYALPHRFAGAMPGSMMLSIKRTS